MNYPEKNKYDINDLAEIVRILRSPDGCPWDKVQTHESIRKDFLEEVYEAVEAIDEKDTAHLREELGDVLLQVVFHSVIETEKGNFTIDDVTDEVCRKMIIRHPHVFGDVEADTTDEVLKNWDAIKMQTHSQTSPSEALETVSKTLPSLMRAEKLHKKARRNGIVPESAEILFDDAESKLKLLREVSLDDSSATEKITGELLFSLVALSAFSGVDFERSLYNACDDFIALFRAYEKKASEMGVDIQDSDTKVTNQIWRSIQKKENLEEIQNEQN